MSCPEVLKYKSTLSHDAPRAEWVLSRPEPTGEACVSDSLCPGPLMVPSTTPGPWGREQSILQLLTSQWTILAVIPLLTKSYLMWALSASPILVCLILSPASLGVTSQVKFLQSLFLGPHITAGGNSAAPLLGTMLGSPRLWCNLHAMRVWMDREWQCGPFWGQDSPGQGEEGSQSQEGSSGDPWSSFRESHKHSGHPFWWTCGVGQSVPVGWPGEGQGRAGPAS